ncbi:KamA family radical SAM protein [Thomasclavelia sp.]|uniref:KamA family radical SAM protein n=1 Tax=Thomasclavelia sp. TaxID=3025757 RepID=UPI0025FF1EBC|nr:KamA family radical SAM protein [Thomasclavelia sp.]
MSWQEELKNSITTAQQLAAILNLDDHQTKEYEKIIERYPMMITPYYLSLVDLNDPNDPIGKMCLPSLNEFDSGGSFDTSGEASNTKLEGLQHKYKQTVLLLSTNQCAMYCRHCFRKRMIGLSNQELNKRVDEVVDYVKKHHEVTNVLITGGDAFMNPNQIIKRYLDELTNIDHLYFIRFGSRVPVTFPQRIYDDKEFLDLFAKYAKKKTIYLVTQFNHPREITSEAIKSIEAMISRGILVRNQTVLLKGVNDDPKVLGELLSLLTKIKVIPYYIFQCRPVTGVKGRFQIPINEGIKIVDQAKSYQNGFGKAVRYVMSHPLGKIEIVCQLENQETLFKFHQNKYPQDKSRIFTRKLSNQAAWLDDNLNEM